MGVGRCVAGAGAVVSDEVPATTSAAATAAEPAVPVLDIRTRFGLPERAGTSYRSSPTTLTTRRRS